MNKQLTDEIAVSYESSATSSYLVLSVSEQTQIISYQVEMLSRNRDLRLLPFHTTRFDDSINISYDITSKISLSHCLKRKSLARTEFIELLSSITEAIIGSKKLLLNHNSFLINENHIYVNPGTMEAALIYLPFKSDYDIEAVMKEFILNLVLNADHAQEQGADNYIQRILTCIRSECFKLAELDKLLRELGSNKAMVEKKDIATKKNEDDANMIKPDDNVKKTVDKPAPKAIKEDTNLRHIGVTTGTKKRYKKNAIIIAALLQILMAAIGVLVFQIVQASNEGKDYFTTASGIVLILAAVDFIALKRLLNKTNMEEVVLEDTASVNISTPVGKIKAKPQPSSLPKAITKDESPKIQYGAAFEKEAYSPETVLISSTESLKVPYLKRIKDGVEERILISKASFIIGRLRGQVDYVIDNNAIGRVHAELIIRDDKLYLKDLNSRNGTKINSSRICGNIEHEIVNKDIICLADCEYELINE